MHEQRRQLVPGDASAPAVGEGAHFLVGRPAGHPEAAEEVHHRHVDLAVRPVAGGVDEPVPTARVDQPVAGPEVTVHERGWLRGPAQLVESPRAAAQQVPRGRVHGSVRDRTFGERLQAAGEQELGPATGRGLVDRHRSQVAARIAVDRPERGSGLGVQLRQASPEIFVDAGAARSGRPLDPLQHEGVLADREHVRHAQGRGRMGAQGSQPRRLAGEHARLRTGVRLQEARAAVAVQTVGLRDVAAGHPGRRPDSQPFQEGQSLRRQSG